MKKSSLILAAVFIAVLFQTSCKKEEEPTPTYKEPTIASRTEIVSIPEGLEAKASTDPNAAVAVIYMGLANAISSFGSSFTVPEDAEWEKKKSGSRIYYWSYYGYSYWMTYSELTDRYTWTYDWEFPGAERFTYISAEEAKTGKNGSWTIFDPEAPSQYVWTYDWSINSSNAFIASLEWMDNDEESSFDVVSNANNSGSFKYFIGSVLNADILWNADGSGTYWIAGDGPAGISGSWTAK